MEEIKNQKNQIFLTKINLKDGQNIKTDSKSPSIELYNKNKKKLEGIYKQIRRNTWRAND